MKHTFVVEAGAERLDKGIAAHVEGLSRRRARQLIKAGAVFVDGQRCQVASRRLDAGARVIVHPEPLHTLTIDDIVVLHEDDDLIVIDKPTGVHVNESETSARRSLQWLLSKRNVHVVHRLDVDTTGVLVFAKNKRTARALSESFAAREVEKTYYAVVAGRPEDGWIDAPIGPDRRRPRARRVVEDGKPARTRIEVCDVVADVASVIATPESGRTHQIRIHLAHVRAPILGDVLYGGPVAVRFDEATFQVSRPLLHATKLVFELDGERRSFSAGIPPDLAALETYGIHFGRRRG